MDFTSKQENLTKTVAKFYQVGWHVLRSVITVTKITFFCKPCHFKTHNGICCIKGWTLMMISGLYSINPASTSLKNDRVQNQLEKHNLIHKKKKKKNSLQLREWIVITYHYLAGHRGTIIIEIINKWIMIKCQVVHKDIFPFHHKVILSKFVGKTKLIIKLS